MKKLLVVLAAAAMLAASGLIYPATMVIDEIDGDTVRMSTASGIVYEMTGAEDYAEGDLVSAVMFSNGTQIITDDIIIIARYSGFTR